MDSIKTFKSRGKLLLTGEYAVLDGALALAVPTQVGQTLQIHPVTKENNQITWLAYKHNGELWFNCILDIYTEQVVKTNQPDIALKLLKIFLEVKKLGSKIFQENSSFECETHLEFPENWGLGTSSTLINNIAKWTKVDPYKLLSQTFGGSGYDIACANAENPITYRLQKEKEPMVRDVYFPSEISDRIIFIYLNNKQNSREGIQHYRQKEKSQALVEAISEITEQIITSKISFEEFACQIIQHENYISKFIEIPMIKEKLFSDYPGFIKSLGAWGGDFIMAEKTDNSEQYFNGKGYKVIKKYDELLI